MENVMNMTTFKKYKCTGAIHRVLYLMLTLMLVFGLGLMGCEGPQGPQGEQGSEGPVGPAGEDGSMMYAGEGAPGDDIGQNGDYYLNQNTGELYGPKDANGWGEPIIVLKGEAGQDGEDGSQIHAGTGAPNESLGEIDDFYLDKSSYELYGPKTSSGWGSPLNLKGADGNANATLYIFPGYDFTGEDFTTRFVDLDSEQEMRESAWLYYLISTVGDPLYYNVPGFGAFGGEYLVGRQWGSTLSRHIINCLSGGCGEYGEIHIVRIAANNTVDNRKQKGAIIPDHLDVSDYEAVVEYYGLSDEDAVGISSQ